MLFLNNMVAFGRLFLSHNLATLLQRCSWVCMRLTAQVGFLRHRPGKLTDSTVHTVTLAMRFQIYPLWEPFSERIGSVCRFGRISVAKRRKRCQTMPVSLRISISVDMVSDKLEFGIRCFQRG